jgi:hypothetical protein
LCDAAALADRKGDTVHSAAWRQAGLALRASIAAKLTDSTGALAK